MAIATVDEVKTWIGLASPTAQEALMVAAVHAGVGAKFLQFLRYAVGEAEYVEYLPARGNLLVRDQLIEGWERVGNKVVPYERLAADRRLLQLTALPVTAVATVHYNPAAWLSDPPDFGAEHLLTAGTGYALDADDSGGGSRTGLLIRNSGPWPAQERSVRVAYTAGLSAADLEGDRYAALRYAFFAQCAIDFHAARLHAAGGMGAGRGAIVAESLGDWSASYDAATTARLYGFSAALAPAVAQALEPHQNWGAIL
jgi:hypothetical protein